MPSSLRTKPNKLVQSVQDSDSETSDEEYTEFDACETSDCEESIGSEDTETEGEDDEDDEEEDEEIETVVKKRKSKRIKSRNKDDEDDDDGYEEGEMDETEVRKEVAKIFPSSYINGKVKRDKELKQKAFNKMDSNAKKTSNKKKLKKRCDDESSSDEEEALIDDENEIFDSDDEKIFLKENYEAIEDIQGEDTKEANSVTKKKKKKKKPDDDDVDISDKFHDEYTELLEERKYRTEKLKKRPDSKVHKKALRECVKEMKNLIKKARVSNTKGYHKLINSQNQELSSEIEYFKKNLSNKEQLKIMKDMKDINDHILVGKPHRLALLQSDMPIKYKANVMQKVNMLKSMEPGDPEYYKVKNWVDDFMQVPFGKYSGLEVNMSHGIDRCNKFMEDAMKILDDCAYGLTDAKMQILQMVGQWISNPQAMGTAIAIKGPMGTGKTTLVKDGISKILQRYFAFIPLGGCGDGSFLEGHSYTYEGSGHGKIVQVLKESKSMNPVFYFDELDKVSESARGEEIIGILTHLTDTSQNNQFHDKYFADVDFDLSKSLFIFSYNDESRVNPILKDRMYCIQTKGYDTKEKLVIARDYLLPKIREQVNFDNEDVIIPDETIEYIISNKSLTKEEAGVRNLKRCLEVIHTKINLFRLVKMDDDNMFSKEIKMKIEFPYTVKKEDVDKLIKSEPPQNQSVLASMYI
jgi:ATP-dependent Lon protease